MTTDLEFYRAVYCAALTGILAAEPEMSFTSDEERCKRASGFARHSLRPGLSTPEGAEAEAAAQREVTP